MRTKHVLTGEDAATIITAAKAEAMTQNWNVSIAVVDDAGFLIQLERMDGAGLASPEIATRKAKTSALHKQPTKVFEEMVKDRPAFGGLFPADRVAVQGGIPVLKDGQVVGAIGVSGVKSNEDEIVALAGRKALAGVDQQ